VSLARGLAIALALLLAACAHKGGKRSAPPPDAPAAREAPAKPAGAKSRYSQEHDSGPAVPADVSKLPEPVPKVEPKSAYGNLSPYTVLGRTYSLRDSCTGYVERGIASWYGTKFHGHLTSNRESYDMYAFSAAHKTLPLPCYARVTNLDNGRSVIVRINDRGPFHEDRIIDLSYAAAVKLGVHATGTGLVEVRTIDPGKPALEGSDSRRDASRTRQDSEPDAARKASLYVQAGAFSDRDNAKKLEAKLENEGVRDVFLDKIDRGGRALHRVRIGPLAGVDAVDRLTARLRGLGIASVAVSID
jgi:rare lipoprotein A